MTTKPIIIVAGEPYSVFLEIFFKSLREKKIKNMKNPIILICSKNLLFKQMKKLKYKYKIRDISKYNFASEKLNNNKINLINVNFRFKNTFDRISSKSKIYIEECLNVALSIVKKNNIKVLINGPISKKHFLKKKFPGMTEYFSKRTNSQGKEVMLIFNKYLAVSPLTTHLPLKKIFKKITRDKILKHVVTIHNFYKYFFKKNVKIGMMGLNPHCETTDKFSEDEKILKPAVKKLRINGINIQGPFAADTIFLKDNLKKFDIIVGMYHDQVLTPIKTIYGFDAINITLGLPFLRVSPDHGPNFEMFGKNISDETSLFRSIEFLENQ